jgi:hypothetical protein
MKRKPRRHLLLGCLVASASIWISCGGGTNGGGNNGGGGGGNVPPLAISTTSLPDGYTGLAYNQTLGSSGGKAPIKWSYSGFFPANLALSASGQISGTVTSAVFGDVNFKATDSSNPPQVVQKSIRMTFHWGLEIAPLDLSPGHIQAPYNSLIQSSQEVDPSSWQITQGSLPPGLTLANRSATQVEVAGTPTATGTFNFTTQVQSSNPTQVATHSFTLVVDSKLAINPAILPDGIMGLSYSAQLSAPNGNPPYSWSSTILPSGLALNPTTGLISGTPNAGGNYGFTVTVSDSASTPHTGTQQLGILVVGQLQLGNSLADAIVNKQYYTNLTVNGGKGPLAWSILSGSLPSGISLNPQLGTFSGVPTQLGTSTFTVQVKDSSTAQQTAQANVTLLVKPQDLVMAQSLPARIPLNVPFTGDAVVTGGIPPYAWSIQSGGLPPGLTLQPSTGELSGTPTTLGSYNFVILATDSATPAKTTWVNQFMYVTPAKGRNDSIAKATQISNGDTYASVSPYADPPDNPSPIADSDYYKIIGTAGSTVKVEIFGARQYSQSLDSVLEIVDANGQRLNTCRLPGDSTNTFTSNCMDDDIPGITTDSELEIKVPGTAGHQTTIYPHVLDWRGDARPDMRYLIEVTGAVTPLTLYDGQNLTWATGQALSYQYGVSGGTPPFTWVVDSGTLPPGLTLSPSGLLSGTPTTVGNYSFTLRVVDGASPAQSGTATFTILVAVRPTITTSSLPNAQTGVQYSYQLQESGGTPSFYWTSSTPLCNQNCLSLNVNAQGILQGIPIYPGTFTITAQVQDHLGFWAQKDLTITVVPGPLVTPNMTLSDGKVGQPYQDFINNTSGGTPEYTFTLAGGTFPPGLTLQTQYQAGAVIGTPTAAGTYVFTVNVTDSGQPTKSSTTHVTLTVTQ